MTPLPNETVLSTLAEMGIAVVGFSLVGSLLRPQSQTDETRLVTLRGVAGLGLIVAIMSAFPLVAHSHGLSEELTWRISSGVFVVWAIAGIVADFARLGRQLPPLAKQYRFTSVLVSALILINLSLLTINVTNPGPGSGARYTTVVLLGLAQSGLMFLSAAFDAGRDAPPPTVSTGGPS